MNQSSSSFGAYEAFRIIVPGYYFAALLMCLAWAVSDALGSSVSIEGMRLFLVFAGVGLIAGLTLYAKESTKRRKAFQENQPSLYLKTKARAMADIPVMEESDARQLYFFILNNHIPAVFHEKIFFFGTIYHIMIQIRRTSLWFAVLATLIAGAMVTQGVALQALGGLLVLAAIAWLLYLLNVRYNKADRKMQENYRDQICWLEMNNDLVETVIRKRYTTQR
jgi:predicted phage tail protein